MDRKRTLYVLICMATLVFYSTFTQAELINKCLWTYSTSEGKFKIINEIASRILKQQEQLIIKSSTRGDLITFNFVPGSLKQEPIEIAGGLWYKIAYFQNFTNILTSQNLFKEVFSHEEFQQIQHINSLIAKGHPIIIPARVTQPESIYNSLKNNLLPSFSQTHKLPENLRKMKKAKHQQAISLKDHADDLHDILEHLRTINKISAEDKIQLTSLSYGVTVLSEFKRHYKDFIFHSHIIAPLSSAGDNFPQQTAMQNQLINNTQMMFTPLKLNPLTYFWGNFFTKYSTDSIYNYSAKTYSENIIKSAFSNDPELQAWEQEFPGFKELVRQGLENDMDAARPDRFNLANEKDFELYKNTTIYLAGDEEPARLKAQFAAWLKMKAVLGKEAPNLVFVDDAQHAITASAPVQTSHIFSSFMLNDAVTSSNGTLFYMHRMDNKANINPIIPELIEILKKEIENEAIGPSFASQIEVIIYPQIFASRIQITALALKDIGEALLLKEPEVLPADFKEDPLRPYLKLRYTPLTPEQREQLNKEVENLAKKLQEYQAIKAQAEEVINKFSAKDRQ